MRSPELICFSCMSPLEFPGEVCRHCGHDNHHRSNDNGFLPASLLQNQYFVGRMLGRGGFGATYLGFDLALERKVAIKEYYPLMLVTRYGQDPALHPYANSEEEFQRGRERTLEEGRMVACIGQVSGIVQMYHVIEANNTVYLVMEYVEGPTLTEWVRANGPMPWTELLTLMVPLMDALHTIHGMKVIHRDVSPDNIIVREKDHRAVLLDFGAAHVFSDSTMSEHSVSLRRGFAPAEQYSSVGQQDGRMDEYALCATMYYALTGNRPPDATERLYAKTEISRPSECGSDIPKRKETVLLKGMAVNADERYASVQALKEALLTQTRAKESAGKQDKEEGDPLTAFALYLLAVLILVIGLEILAWDQGGLMAMIENFFSGI